MSEALKEALLKQEQRMVEAQKDAMRQAIGSGWADEEPAELNTEKLTGPIHASMTNTGVVITFRNSSGDEGWLVFQDDEETRFEGNPEAFVGPFLDMFGEHLNEYIDRRVERALNAVSNY